MSFKFRTAIDVKNGINEDNVMSLKAIEYQKFLDKKKDLSPITGDFKNNINSLLNFSQN